LTFFQYGVYDDRQIYAFLTIYIYIEGAFFMKKMSLAKLAIAASFVIALGTAMVAAPTPGYADSSDNPCDGLRGKKKRKCESKQNRADRELYLAGYELAEQGKYKEALKILHSIKSRDIPAVLTYIGFSTRKLGDIDGAMKYYNRSLEIAPDFALTRSYLGQAYLQKGNPDKADEQLIEISKRCGKSCKGYGSLEKAIAQYKLTHS